MSNRFTNTILDIAVEVTSITGRSAQNLLVAARPVRTQSNRGDDPWRD